VVLVALTKKETEMEIKINVIEVASDLAHESMKDEIKFNEAFHNYPSEEDLYEPGNPEAPDEGLIYKEKYQEIFNRWYDYYFEMITNRQLI